MGCCLSTDKQASVSKKHQHLNVGSESSNLKATRESRAPPPSIEEETVKEVLSETPKLRPHIAKPIEEEKENKETHLPIFGKIHEEHNGIIERKPQSPTNIQADEISEVSEICSLSMSESVSTTTITERRDDDEEEVRQRVIRSPAKFQQRNRDLGAKRERVLGMSPTRKSEESPAKRNGGVGGGGRGSMRLVQSRGGEAGQAMVRRVARRDPQKRDTGESSGRRSRSPAATRSAMGRSPSAKRANRSPGRVRVDPAAENGSSRKVESNRMEGKWPSNGNTNESLENPLVSLECFIFL